MPPPGIVLERCVTGDLQADDDGDFSVLLQGLAQLIRDELVISGAGGLLLLGDEGECESNY